VATFVVVWLAFGLVAFAGDVVFQRLVDATPWLAARPWLIETGILVVAGAYQLAPLKRRCLAACRHSPDVASVVPITTPGAARLGLHHGLACLGSSWALMLLMFVEGFASLPWVVALTAVMTYEAAGRHGRSAASAVGAVLLLIALTVLLVSLLGGA
jgi:predicted metal-binding membrane protein